MRKLYIVQGCEHQKRILRGPAGRRHYGRIVMMGSPDGGMDIEEVAEKTPRTNFPHRHRPAVGHDALPSAADGLLSA